MEAHVEEVEAELKAKNDALKTKDAAVKEGQVKTLVQARDEASKKVELIKEESTSKVEYLEAEKAGVKAELIDVTNKLREAKASHNKLQKTVADLEGKSGRQRRSRQV